MKWTAYYPLKCQGLALRLDVAERDPRGKYIVKYGPEMENSTRFHPRFVVGGQRNSESHVSFKSY